MSTLLSKDRIPLCSFTFADGRRCRTPRAARSHFCIFHARKEAQALAAKQVGHDISYCLSGHYLSACDLSSALGHVFSAVARGDVNRKTATTLAYLGQTLVQTIPLAQHEYINAFGTESWRRAVRDAFALPAQEPAPEPEPEPQLLPDAATPSHSGEIAHSNYRITTVPS